MKLTWAQHALADRENIFDYIEAASPRAAVLVDERIATALSRLLEFPESGKPGRLEGTRELVIPRTPYVAAYAVYSDRIRVLRILHGAQIWPDAM